MSNRIQLAEPSDTGFWALAAMCYYAIRQSQGWVSMKSLGLGLKGPQSCWTQSEETWSKKIEGRKKKHFTTDGDYFKNVILLYRKM